MDATAAGWERRRKSTRSSTGHREPNVASRGGAHGVLRCLLENIACCEMQILAVRLTSSM